MPTHPGQLQRAMLDWNLISLHVPRRDQKACHKRWHYSLDSRHNIGNWASDKDEKLQLGMQQYGQRWARVAEIVQTRNGDQCLRRWRNCLDPSTNRAPWTTKEDSRLQYAVSLHGNKWAYFSKVYFTNRDPSSIRNRLQVLHNQQSRMQASAATQPILFLNSRSSFERRAGG